MVIWLVACSFHLDIKKFIQIVSLFFCSVVKQMADEIAQLQQWNEDLVLKLEQVRTCNLSLASSRKTTNSTPIFFVLQYLIVVEICCLYYISFPFNLGRRLVFAVVSLSATYIVCNVIIH